MTKQGTHTVEVLDIDGKVTRTIQCSSYKAAHKEYRVVMQRAIRKGGDARIVDSLGTVVA